MDYQFNLRELGDEYYATEVELLGLIENLKFESIFYSEELAKGMWVFETMKNDIIQLRSRSHFEHKLDIDDNWESDLLTVLDDLGFKKDFNKHDRASLIALDENERLTEFKKKNLDAIEKEIIKRIRLSD